MELSDGLRQLLDERDIHNCILRYARAVDRFDLDGIRACYHPDGRDEHGSFSGGVDEFVDWLARVLPRNDVTVHTLSNVLIDFDPSDPDRARAETYGVAEHHAASGVPNNNMTTWFRYVDRFERRDGEWRIADRTCITELVRRTDPGNVIELDERFRRGVRGTGGDLVQLPWAESQS